MTRSNTGSLSATQQAGGGSGIRQIARAPSKKRKVGYAKAWSFAWMGGSLPVIPGEKKDDYRLVQRMVMDAFQPEDAIEHILAKDLADAVYLIERLKKLPSYYMEQAWWNQARSAVEAVSSADPITKESKSAIADRYIRGLVREPSGVTQISERLAEAGVKPQWLAADAAWSSLDVLEGFERLLQTAEQRRDRLLRQLGDWRDRRNGSGRNPLQRLSISTLAKCVRHDFGPQTCLQPQQQQAEYRPA
jgi:hypothetical protein